MRFLFTGLLLLSSIASARIDMSMEPLVLAGLSRSFHLGRTELPHVVSVKKKSVGDRDRFLVQLSDEVGAPFRLVIDGPRGFAESNSQYPLLFVSAGFFAGTQPVNLLQDKSNFVIAAFEYTAKPEELISTPDKLLETLKQVPARLFFSVRWLQEQAWVQHDQVHLLGLSLGSLYLPVALRLLQSYKIPFASFISGFGGAEVRIPFYHVLLDYIPEHDAANVAEGVEFVTAPFDPGIFLPHVKGPKLLIHGLRDQLFTQDVSDRLDATITGPRMICKMDTQHIDLDRPQEIRLAIGVIKAWLFSMVAGRGFPNVRQEKTSCYSSAK